MTGQRVQAKWSGDGQYYPATIQKSDATHHHVLFDDGLKEKVAHDDTRHIDSPDFIAGKAKHNVAIAVAESTKLGHPFTPYNKPGSSAAAIRSNTDGKIYINSSHPYWKDPVRWQKH